MAEDKLTAPATVSPVAADSKLRDWMELAVGYGWIVAVLWTPRPLQTVLYFFAIVLFLVLFWRSFAGWPAMGLRTANLLRSSWVVVAAFLLAAVAVLISLRLGMLHVPHGPMRFLKRYSGYVVWAFAQQILLLDFFLMRLLRRMPGRKSAVLATAGIFALAHVPNPVLAPLTLLWGVIACVLFLRYCNLYPLALAHAIFGICIAITVPGPTSHHMRVGLGYLQYRPPAHPHRSQIDHIVSTHAWVIAEAPTLRC